MKKLEELVLYIAHRSKDDPKFGATKLNKILFWSDFLAYGYMGESITGAHYIRKQHGPVPREVLIASTNLVNEGRAEIVERLYFGKIQKRIVPLENPDLTGFTPDQLTLVDQMITALADGNATEVSEVTHNLRPWLDALQDEEIPYETVFVLSDTPVTLDDKEWGRRKLKELQLT